MLLKIKFFFLVVIIYSLLSQQTSCQQHQQEDEEDTETETTIENENVASTDANEPKPKYVKPIPKGPHHFVETFDFDIIGTKWIKSAAKKADVDEIIAKYEGEWKIEEPKNPALEGDKGLVLKSKAKHHAISARLLKPFDFSKNKPLILQYEVQFQNALECGGSYVKLLTDEPNLNLENFLDKTSYTIMFGPDKCGTDSKVHFILRYKHPLKGTFEEKHAKKTENIEPFFSDGRTHLYTLILRPDNRFQIFIDQNEMNSGSLLTDLTPAINPDKEIVDPNDKKPSTWDDNEKIADANAVKPDDWNENEPKQIADPNAVKPDGWLDDEPQVIPDPFAVKPDDWDNETDGEWEAPKIDNPKCESAPGCGKWEVPLINNPNYKGKWIAPLIDNPNYQGKWEPRKIPNPDYFVDNDPFKSIVSFSAIGLELWSMTDDIYFDNFLITDDETVANEFAKDSWALKKAQNLKLASSDSVIDGIINATRDKPWLWAVYILVILVPIVLVVFFCCGSSKKSTSETSGSAAELHAKKTDQETADEPEEEEEEEEGDATTEEKVEKKERDEEESLLKNKKDTKKQSKAQAKAEAAAAAVDEEVDGEDAKAKSGSTDNTSPRKRRTARKD